MFPSPVLLVGFMGSGKSTVGRRLAQRLGWYFVDLDDRIESVAGASIPEIFARRGEADFREIEQQQLAACLAEAAGDRRTVLALGGGTFAQLANVELIQRSGGIVVFLDVNVEELLLRCAQMTNRPLFRDERSFRELYEYRLPYYRAAHITVAAGGSAPEQVVDAIVSAIATLGGNRNETPRPGPANEFAPIQRQEKYRD
jgi:shikimate kinase